MTEDALVLKKKRSLVFFSCMAVAATLAELTGLNWMSRPYGLPMAAAQHLVVCSILVLWVFSSKRKRDNRFALLLAIMTAAAGAFGSGLCLLAGLVYASPLVKINTSPSKWINDFISEEKTADSDKLHERLVFGQDNITGSGVEPFQDILQGGTVLQKQMAIAKITQYFQPRFAPLLLQAVQDSNAAVRVQAATGLAKIEHDFMSQYLHHEKIGKTAANDDFNQIQIAEICDNYAHAGILDEDSCNSLRAKAIVIYEASLKDKPELQMPLARLYLRQKQPEKTCQLLSESVESGTITPAALLWYMEALFMSGKHAQLRQVAKQYAPVLKEFDGYKSLGETENAFGMWWHADDEKTYAA